MKHTYTISNMTCQGCVAHVKSRLLMHPDILEADVTLDPPAATVTMDRHLTAAQLQEAIGADSKYRISGDMQREAAEMTERSWLETYKPILLIAAYILLVSGIAAYQSPSMNYLAWMNYFMAGFFIVFSFFKMLDISGFADSYAMYDLLAMRWKGYGYLYPFIELALGIAYLSNADPVITNTATIVVMGFSSLGVIRSVLSKKQIRCACLGAVFNLPMSTVTIIEDLLMVLMAVAVLAGFH